MRSCLSATVYAEKAGVTQGYISQVVNGDIKGVKLETLEKLVTPLEITVSDFLKEVEKKDGGGERDAKKTARAARGRNWSQEFRGGGY